MSEWCTSVKLEDYAEVHNVTLTAVSTLRRTTPCYIYRTVRPAANADTQLSDLLSRHNDIVIC